MRPPIATYLLHVLLPVGGLASLVVVLQATWRLALEVPGMLALLGGAVVVYTGERLLERRSELGPRHRLWLGGFGAAAALLVGWQVFIAPRPLLPIVVPLALLSLAYRLLERVPFAKELAVAACWGTGAAVLPFSTESTRWELAATPAAWAVAALVLAGTLLCDVKDAASDAHRGVASAPVIVGERWTRVLAGGVAVVAAGLACAAGAWPLAVASALLVWLAACPRLLARPLWGPIAVDAALCVPGLVVVVIGGGA